MKFLQRRAPKRFSYKPRHYKADGNPYEIKHMFEDFREASEPARGLKAKVRRALNDPLFGGDPHIRKRFIIILLILILIVLYILDFDLSIFIPKQ